MSTTYDYRYYIEGRKLAILQRKIDQSYDPYVELVDDLFVTPTVADSSAIFVRYTIVPTTVPNDENTDLNLGRNIEMAIVHYVFRRLEEEKDPKDYRAIGYHDKQFRYYLSRERNARKGPGQTVGVHYTGAVK